MYARKQKTFALTAVHPAYACEATTAKEPARSQVAELEPCYFTHTLAIDEVGPACSSMAPVVQSLIKAVSYIPVVVSSEYS